MRARWDVGWDELGLSRDWRVQKPGLGVGLMGIIGGHLEVDPLD